MALAQSEAASESKPIVTQQRVLSVVFVLPINNAISAYKLAH